MLSVTKLVGACGILTLTLIAAPSYAHEIKLGQLVIVHPWLKQSPDGKVAFACMKIINKSRNGRAACRSNSRVNWRSAAEQHGRNGPIPHDGRDCHPGWANRPASRQSFPHCTIRDFFPTFRREHDIWKPYFREGRYG